METEAGTFLGILGPDLFGAVMLTLKTCAAAAVGFLLAAPPLAWLFARRSGALTRVLSFVVTLPLVFPPIALGYLLLLLIGRSGPVGAMLETAGLSVVFTSAAVALAAFIAGLPLVIRPIEGALASERLKALEFAARVHGASPARVFVSVTLPLVRREVLSGLLLGVSRASGEVGITMMIGGNIQGRTNTLSLEIYNAVSRADFDAATILCLMLSAFTLVVFAVLEGLRRGAKAL
ncbi:molybdenum ABC transporter permease [Sutterella sp.]|uniref:molybdate ABC transporter permease subunit n=1 Tax=Sutterella sp. TaxID=1981025 RepID=UPI0026DEB123|nr:ABC transporter permease subunit [Sutterella sp.]MDO5531938.1 ABC transporter permease subunit [Sutterella sp.]